MPTTEFYNETDWQGPAPGTSTVSCLSRACGRKARAPARTRLRPGCTHAGYPASHHR